MTGLGENIGKAEKVLGIRLDPGHGTSFSGGKRNPSGEVKEGSAEGAEDQVLTLYPFVLVEASNTVFPFAMIAE